jgi:DNA-binding MarR family transcriptional regulator
MGRPKKAILKSAIVRVRFTHAEKRVLMVNADKAGISLSDLIRSKMLDIKIVARLTMDEITILRNLIGAATNLNEIAKRVHLGISNNEQIMDCLNQINRVINKLNDK